MSAQRKQQLSLHTHGARRTWCSDGTEAPAAYLGVATGAILGDRWWCRLLRPLAVGGVALLMGIPLVGTPYILELGRRHHAPLNAERVTTALMGGFVGWLFPHFPWCGPDLLGCSQGVAAHPCIKG